MLKDAVASFECQLTRDELVGEHHVFFGEVAQVTLPESCRALIYTRRAYGTSLSIPAAPVPRNSGTPQRLCLACVSSFAPVLPPSLLVRLRNALPDLHVDIVEGDQAQVAYLVESGEAHFGLLYDRALPPTLATTVMERQRPYVLFEATDPLASNPRPRLAELADAPLSLLDQPLSRDYITGLFAACGVAPTIAMRSTSFEMVRSIVGQGLGYAVLLTRPRGNISYEGHKLAVRNLAGDPEPIAVSLAWRNTSSTGEKFPGFIDVCVAYFAGREESRR